MKKIYEAEGTDKRDYIEVYNSLLAFDLAHEYKKQIDVKHMLMVSRTNSSNLNSMVDLVWSLNGIKPCDDKEDKNDRDDILIIDRFVDHVDQGLENVYMNNTYYNKPIKLSRKSIVLMPSEKYDELIENKDMKNILKKLNVRVYEGQEDLALMMLFFEKRYVYLKMNEEGYDIKDKDVIGFANILVEKQQELVESINKFGLKVTYGERQKEVTKSNSDSSITIDNKDDYNNTNGIFDNDKEEKNNNYEIISGVTEKKEGKIELDDDLKATTDIGKSRERQEDAVLLIKDKENPDFKMMVVADGLGGMLKGNIASDVVVNQLKEWFEGLSEIEKSYFYTDISKLKESLNKNIYEIARQVEEKTDYSGASTLVCALVGKNNTMITNVGDSRAYYFKDGKLEQISVEDSYANENLRKGKVPDKEAARFDPESCHITQCVGMGRRYPMKIHNTTIDNNEYDMMLLFSDGVTDCLSDEDIAVVCRNTDKKELTNKIVEKAIKHDSMIPEKYMDYAKLDSYIPGGKDNTTAAAYTPTKDDKNNRNNNDELELEL